jgi:hypothetical protein
LESPALAAALAPGVAATVEEFGLTCSSSLPGLWRRCDRIALQAAARAIEATARIDCCTKPRNEPTAKSKINLVPHQ